MELKTKNTRLLLGEKGSICSYQISQVEFLAKGGEHRPLFSVRMRTEKGSPLDISSFMFEKVDLCTDKEEVYFDYDICQEANIHVKLRIRTLPDQDRIEFEFEIQNRSHFYVEYIDCPDVTVPEAFFEQGGILFWPGMEGCEIQDPHLRDIEPTGLCRYMPVDYPTKGWEGFYPGPVAMQYMACYDGKNGFYFAAEDVDNIPKAIEYHTTYWGVRLEYRFFVCVGPGESCERPFPIVLQSNVSDWMDAAEIYRQFVETFMVLPKPISENEKLPDWYHNSPVVLAYPVRGEKDTGNMEPNRYFPYVRAEELLLEYSNKLETQVMPLLMHWEGTAPWAPPYIWPPYGGEETFAQFVSDMHKKGQLVGLYASGIAWTNQSVLCQEYDRSKQYQEEELKTVMCAAPDQSVPHAFICNGPIRWGHDMCPENEFTVDTVVDEIAKVVEAGVDYLQYFDQNIGGTPSRCYSDSHGHPPVPGKWMVQAMNRLYQKTADCIKRKGSSTLIGCEGAAAETYIGFLPFSDLRYNITVHIGRPVPAYAYVYHKYTVNFMGNQNSFETVVPHEKNQWSLHFRMAYSFIAGDMLTGVLNGKGELHWDWGTPWEIPSPEQKNLLNMMRAFVRMRKQEGKPFLHYGKMCKGVPYQTEEEFAMIRRDGSRIVYPKVLSSAWIAPDGRKAQVFANYTPGDATIRMAGKDGKEVEVKIPEFDCVLMEETK